MNKFFFILLFLALAAYGQQQERVAIINTVDDRDSIGVSSSASGAQTTSWEVSFFTDARDGKKYKVVKIGKQIFKG